MSGGTRLQLRDVSVTYRGGVVALRGVSLTVEPGEFVALLGPSGAGKSTLLRTINGLVPYSSGEVRVGGRLVSARTLRGVRAEVAMVFQSAGLVPRATVLENVLAGALRRLGPWRALLGWWPRAWRKKACALLAEVGLKEAHLYRRAATLSGGEQQRVGIARAFMAAPKLLLADEPVASLDPATSRDVLELIRRLAANRGCAVLCSLHQMDLARAYADRGVALRSAAVRWVGPMAQFDDITQARIFDHEHCHSDE